MSVGKYITSRRGGQATRRSAPSRGEGVPGESAWVTPLALQVAEDGGDDVGIQDEGDDAHLAAAAPISRTRPRSTRLARRLRVARGERSIACAISRVESPLPGASTRRMASSTGSTSGDPVRSVCKVTRKRVPISSRPGGARPAERHAAVIRWIPLPHCSMRPNSWKTRPITRLRSLEMPRRRSSTVRPKGRRPGFSTSSRSSKIDSRMGAPRWA